MPVGDVWKANTFCRRSIAGLAQTSMNQLYYQVIIETGAPITAGGVRAAVAARFRAAYLDLFAITSFYKGVSAQKVFPLPVGVTDFLEETVAGNRVTETLPGQVCGVITKRTPFGGRRFRGRIYTPFPTEDSSDDFTGPNAAYIALLQVLGNLIPGTITVVQGANSSDFTPVIFHGGALPLPTLITSALARPRWGTQRSRGGYGAENGLPIG